MWQLMMILTLTMASSSYASFYSDDDCGHSGLQLVSQSVHLDEIPTKVIRITKTVAVKVPVPYPVKIPHHVPVPVPVNHPIPFPVPKIVKVPQPIPYEVSKHVTVGLPQQVPLVITKAIQLPHPVPIPHPVKVNHPVPIPVPYPIHLFNRQHRLEDDTHHQYHQKQTTTDRDGGVEPSSHDPRDHS